VNNLLLYSTTVLIWGSTFFAIKFQLGLVAPMLSVAYRFMLAAVLLIIYCVIKKYPMKFTLREHGFMAAQGFCLFAINYVFVYEAEHFLTSGLVAVIFSCIMIFNILFSTLLLGHKAEIRVIIGAATGLIGISLVFWQELSQFNLSNGAAAGLFLGLIGTLFASLGNILSSENQKNNIPVLQTNAYGMAYGGIMMLILAAVLGKEFTFSYTIEYISALFYLAVFGSIIAFGAYLTLVGRIGAGKASYATLLFPLVALLISTWFEGYQWNINALVGVGLILSGNLLIITKVNMRDKLLRLFNIKSLVVD